MIAEIAAAVAGAIATTACAAVSAVFLRLRRLERMQAEDVERFKAIDQAVKSVGEMQRDLNGLKVQIAREFVHREDWVPAISRITGALEKQGETLARVDERTGR